MPYREPLKFRVVENIAVIADWGDGSLELNRVIWGNNMPRLDLRKWTCGRPGKGITLTAPQAVRLRDALAVLDLTEGEPAGADPAQPPWQEPAELRT